MMTEISLNILDVAENSTRAGADLVEISVLVDTRADRLTIVIKDDGCGMTKEQLTQVEDPFSRRVRHEKWDSESRFLRWPRSVRTGVFTLIQR